METKQIPNVTVRDLCARVRDGTLQFGDKLFVIEERFPQYQTTEIVINNGQGFADTIISEKNGKRVNESTVPEFRYFSDGRCMLLHTGHERGYMNYHGLLEVQN